MPLERRETQMFRTGKGQEIAFADICKRMMDFYVKSKEYDSHYNIIIGTDSQNHDKTKIVSVVCITCAGHGGIFFYEITREKLIKDVRQKLQTETALSLNLATAIVEQLESDRIYEEMYLNCPISIHVDAGNSPKGKTAELIPEIVGWIKACGYDAFVKPESFVASSIADKISK